VDHRGKHVFRSLRSNGQHDKLTSDCVSSFFIGQPEGCQQGTARLFHGCQSTRAPSRVVTQFVYPLAPELSARGDSQDCARQLEAHRDQRSRYRCCLPRDIEKCSASIELVLKAMGRFLRSCPRRRSRSVSPLLRRSPLLLHLLSGLSWISLSAEPH
jgi:hypothetical protein